MTSAKVTINVQEGLIQLEGSEDFVTKHLKECAKLLENFRGHDLGGAKSAKKTPEDAGGPKTTKKRNGKRSGAKRGGPSCGSRIREMQAQGFFEKPRSAKEVEENLKELATPYEGKHVAAALIQEAKTKKLRRIQEDGVWAYVNP